MRRRLKYSDDQPRDDNGQFGDGNGDSGSGGSDSGGSEGTYGTNSEAYDKAVAGAKISDATQAAIDKYSDYPADEEVNATIEQALKDGEGMQVTTKIYRGLSMKSDAEVRKTFGKVGAHIKPTFIQSTSVEKDVAEEFAGLTDKVAVVLTIQPRSGSNLRGMPIKKSGQSEIAISKNSYLQIVSKPSKVGNVWHLHVMADTL